MPPPSLNLYGLLFVLALRMRVSVKGMTVSPNYMEQVYCRNIPSKIPSNFPVARERSRLKASIQRNIYLAFQWLVGRLRLDANICERQCGWGGRIRTSAWWNQNPLPYHLATPQQAGSGSGGSRLPPSLRQRRSIEGVEPFQPAGGRNFSESNPLNSPLIPYSFRSISISGLNTRLPLRSILRAGHGSRVSCRAKCMALRAIPSAES
jgi:hypothetical protein